MTASATISVSDLTEVHTPGEPEHHASLTDIGSGSLVLAARNGSRPAWEELVHRFTPLLWAVARGHRLSADDAADAVQMTWLRCVERLDQVRDPDSVAAWLMAICRRESLALLRRRAPARSDPAAAIAATPDPLAGEVADALIGQEERTILREAVVRLPDRRAGSCSHCWKPTKALATGTARLPDNFACRSAASDPPDNAHCNACGPTRDCIACATTDVTGPPSGRMIWRKRGYRCAERRCPHLLLGDGPDGGLYYDAHPVSQMPYRLTMLAY